MKEEVISMYYNQKESYYSIDFQNYSMMMSKDFELSKKVHIRDNTYSGEEKILFHAHVQNMEITIIRKGIYISDKFIYMNFIKFWKFQQSHYESIMSVTR